MLVATSGLSHMPLVDLWCMNGPCDKLGELKIAMADLRNRKDPDEFSDIAHRLVMSKLAYYCELFDPVDPRDAVCHPDIHVEHRRYFVGSFSPEELERKNVTDWTHRDG